MVCNKCNESGVLNEVLGQQFYYCRGCKDEISLVSPPQAIEWPSLSYSIQGAPDCIDALSDMERQEYNEWVDNCKYGDML